MVESCKAVVRQYGQGASTCPVTHALAKASKNLAEDRCHETCRDVVLFPFCRLFPHMLSVDGLLRFRKHGLTLDVPISWVPLPSLEENALFPILKISDMVRSLGRIGCLNKLFGDLPEADIQDTLREFWRRYALHTPDHQVFSASVTGAVCQGAFPISSTGMKVDPIRRRASCF